MSAVQSEVVRRWTASSVRCAIVAVVGIAASARCGDEEFTANAQRVAQELEPRVAEALGLSTTRTVRVLTGDTGSFTDSVGRHAALVRLAELRGGGEGRRALLRVRRSEVEDIRVAAGGMYIPETHEIMLPAAWSDPALSSHLRSVIIHELVHAQRLQAGQYEACASACDSGDLDWAIGTQALVEGDAVFWSIVIRESELNRIPLQDAAAFVAARLCRAFDRPAALPAVRSYLRGYTSADQDLYLFGTLFVARIWSEGGVSAIAGALRAPPRSSEQILHPEKYYAKVPDEPTVFVLHGTEHLPGDLQVTDSGVMGELDLRRLLGEGMEDTRSAGAAAGWDGAYFEIVKGGDGSQLFAMISSWDSECDASEFAHAWCEWAARRFVDSYSVRTRWMSGGERHEVMTSDGLAQATRREMEVLVTLGLEGFDCRPVTKRLWAARRIERTPGQLTASAPSDESK